MPFCIEIKPEHQSFVGVQLCFSSFLSAFPLIFRLLYFSPFISVPTHTGFTHINANGQWDRLRQFWQQPRKSFCSDTLCSRGLTHRQKGQLQLLLLKPWTWYCSSCWGCAAEHTTAGAAIPWRAPAKNILPPHWKAWVYLDAPFHHDWADGHRRARATPEFQDCVHKKSQIHMAPVICPQTH